MFDDVTSELRHFTLFTRPTAFPFRRRDNVNKYFTSPDLSAHHNRHNRTRKFSTKCPHPFRAHRPDIIVYYRRTSGVAATADDDDDVPDTILQHAHRHIVPSK